MTESVTELTMGLHTIGLGAQGPLQQSKHPVRITSSWVNRKRCRLLIPPLFIKLYPRKFWFKKFFSPWHHNELHIIFMKVVILECGLAFVEASQSGPVCALDYEWADPCA